MKFKKQPAALAIIYVAASLAIEAALMVAGHLKPPRDNGILAAVVLTVPPVLAAWLCGYRGLREIGTVAVLLSALTLGFTLLVSRISGVTTGMAEPIVNRVVAGLLAGLIANKNLGNAPAADSDG